MMALVPIMISSIVSCGRDCLNPNSVEQVLNTELSVGDDREKIEGVLKNHGLKVSYDKYSNRYSSYIKSDCDKFKAISVYIQLDRGEKVLSIEVFNSYTML